MRNYLNRLIDRVQGALPPNRVVALLTPLLTPPIAIAAAWLSPWAAQHLPGLPTFTPAELTAFGIAGAAAVVVPAVRLADRFIDGWQKHEGAQAALVRALVDNPLPVEQLEVEETVSAVHDGLAAAGGPSQRGAK